MNMVEKVAEALRIECGLPDEDYEGLARAAIKATGVEQMREALIEVMIWIKNWDPNFVEDDEWPDTEAKIDAALEEE